MKILGFNIANNKPQSVTVDDFVDAIEQDQLCLNYLPLIDIQTKKVVELEALLRWPQRHERFIPPMDFITLAANNQLMPRLSRWVIKTVSKQTASWQSQGLKLNQTINLSGYDFSDSSLTDFIVDCINQHGLVAHQLGFELPQTALDQSQPALDFVERLQQIGVRIVIDNVSGDCLRSLPSDRSSCDTIKIDHRLIMAMLHSPAEQIAVENIIHNARKHGLRVVAPGVFSKRILTMMEAMGCQFAQGFYISPPQTAVDLDIWLRISSWAPNISCCVTHVNASTAEQGYRETA